MQHDIRSSLAGTSAASATRRSKARFVILILITVGTMINYLDRAVMGVAAPSLSAELGFGAAVMGIVFSAFSWSYTAAQVPGGVLLDRIGARITYFLSVTIWSVFTLAQGMVSGLTSLIACRLGLGVAEAPCFPANSRVLSTWFPQHERARANSAYSVGQYFGLAFLSPLLFWIVGTFGWRAVFYVAGALGLLFAPIWYVLYRDPHHSKHVNKAELDYIEAGGGLGADAPRRAFSWQDIWFLLRQRQILGASIGQFAGNSTLVFFLTWFPTYLATERQMDWLKVGIFAMLPYIAASIGVLVGGWVSDTLIKRTGSANIGRKLPIVGGLLLASTIIAANYVDDNVVVIGIMSLAFFGQGMVNLGWTLISDVAPKPLIGLTGGVFNFMANLAGIITPMVVGFIVAATGSFFGALAFIGVLAIIGALSYIFILGDVVRVAMPDEKRPLR
jgi:ACS family D-galactonate transporter-like MFS transporter